MRESVRTRDRGWSLMMLFSTDTELERVGVVGLDLDYRWVGC